MSHQTGSGTSDESGHQQVGRPNRTKEDPYFGWLQTTVPTYGDTLNIKTIATEQEIGLIPEIKSIEEGHRLTIEQENGITYKRALEIVDEIIRRQHNAN